MLPCHGLKIFWFCCDGGPDFTRRFQVKKIRPPPVAEQDRLLPETGIVPVPVNQFGHVFRIHIIDTEIEHEHPLRIMMKGNHLVRINTNSLLCCGLRFQSIYDGCQGGVPEQLVKAMLVNIPIP